MAEYSNESNNLLDVSSTSNADHATDGAKAKSCCPFFGNGALFDPKKLDPKVVELIYWRNPKKTGIVFGSGLVLLLSLLCYTVIGLIAYASLIALTGFIAFRVYKNVIAAVQKTNEGHPFKAYLEKDIEITRERGHQAVDCSLSQINSLAAELRRLFLVEDLVDSVKFGGVLWLLTYIGSWFNGLTLVILIYLSVFSIPIVYETHKEQIDVYVKLASEKVNEVVTLVKAKLPGCKPKEQ